MRLERQDTFTLYPIPPFHFEGTFHKPSYFPNKLKMSDWEPSRYWQSLRVGKRLYGLEIENKGTATGPKLTARVYSDRDVTEEERGELRREIIWRFELDVDLTEFIELTENDTRFYPVFTKWMGMRNSGPNTLYELLIIAIVLQNATVRRSQQMLDTLLEKYGIKLEFDEKELWAIWLPEDLINVEEQELRDLKVGYRAKFIKRLSQEFVNGIIDEYRLRELDEETAWKELMKLYGVGPETARILLFEAFHRYDVFDHIAPWQQKIYSRLFYGEELVSVDKIRDDIMRQYGKYSMLAVHYIWEDIFWKRKSERIEWLEKEIRL